MRSVLVNIAATLMIGVLSVASAEAQESACDLKLKVYSYKAIDRAKARLQNVSVRLRGKEVDQRINIGVGSEAAGFKGLKERTYELEISKPGYKTRRKKIELDCRLRYGDAVWDHTYLWKDGKTDDETDLVEDSKDDSAKELNSAGIGSAEVSKAADDKVFGKVNIQVLIDVDGNVLSASRVGGESKLAERAILMARKAKFSPTIVSGEAVQVSGTLTYNFVP